MWEKIKGGLVVGTIIGIALFFGTVVYQVLSGNTTENTKRSNIQLCKDFAEFIEAKKWKVARRNAHQCWVYRNNKWERKYVIEHGG